MAREPNFQPPWNEVESGHYVATCGCGEQHYHVPPADRRVRQDPYDPATMRHFGQCEHRDTTDLAIVKGLLTVHERDGYWWVICNSCKAEWQVMYYAEPVG